MEYIAFRILNDDNIDDISRCPLFRAILYQLWHEGVFRAFFGDLEFDSDDNYVRTMVNRWDASRLPMYG